MEKYYDINVRETCNDCGGSVSFTIPLVMGEGTANSKAEGLRARHPTALVTLIPRGTIDDMFIEENGIGIH